MSMISHVYRVFGSEVEPLRRTTKEEFRRLLFGPEGGTGWEMDPERMLVLDKAWDAVSYVLAGSHGRPHRPPLTFLADDTTGERVDYEFTYGKGRLIAPDLVTEIAAHLSALPSATVEARLDDAASMRQLYPFAPGEYTSDDREWVAASFSELSAFVLRAAKLDCGLLVGIN
jgi:hypothetical protein